jgi:hypothetical protein
MPTITFPVSGAAISTISGSELMQRPERYDGTPAAIRAGNALNTAPSRKYGKGYAVIVTTDVEAASVIWEYCDSVGSTFAMETEPETRADGRALLAVRDRVEREIVKAGCPAPTQQQRSLPPAPAPAAEPELMSQVTARRTAEQRNARGDVLTGTVAIATTWPEDAWGGEEEGWWVKLVPTGDGSTPSHERRNHTPLRDGKTLSGKPGEYALMGGKGEPVRTWADMRWALADQMKRYLSRFPDPAGAVDDALAQRVAALIVGDHYVHPATVIVTREQLLKYVAVVREQAGA